jgi:hypothetical protein
MPKEKDIDYKQLFQLLTEPMSCGAIINGVRHQKSQGEWSSERIFVLSDELDRYKNYGHKPSVFFRTFFDSDGSWRAAIKRYVGSDRAFKHPRLRMACIQSDSVTFRNLDFDLDFK